MGKGARRASGWVGSGGGGRGRRFEKRASFRRGRFKVDGVGNNKRASNVEIDAREMEIRNALRRIKGEGCSLLTFLLAFDLHAFLLCASLCSYSLRQARPPRGGGGPNRTPQLRSLSCCSSFRQCPNESLRVRTEHGRYDTARRTVHGEANAPS
jgi:hypothetical protein